MAQRGQKSAQALAALAQNVIEVPRYEPPVDMPDEQQAIWTRIINRQPAEWFTDANIDLLENYIRHLAGATRINILISKTERKKSFDVDEYDKLLKMRERETRAASSLATRMRLTQQAQYSDRKTQPASKTIEAPWNS
jgi:hypothetical protein